MNYISILYIGPWSSRCGVCGKGAFPHEKTHAKEAGYGKNKGNGCGTKWTHVSTDYAGLDISDMRPDLICIDQFKKI